MQTTAWRPAGVDLSSCCGTTTNLYVIREEEDGPVKIGLARKPAERLLTLQQGNPRRLSLVCSLPLRAEAEKRLHLALKPDLVLGEWFAPTPAVLAAVGEIYELSRMIEDYKRDGFDDFNLEDFDAILEEHSLDR